MPDRINVVINRQGEYPCLFIVDDLFNGIKNNQRGYFMYNTKFITDNGKDVYPGYLDREQRALIRNQYMEKRNMCGARAVRMQDFIIKSAGI